jgi:hypothetical protein
METDSDKFVGRNLNDMRKSIKTDISGDEVGY